MLEKTRGHSLNYILGLFKQFSKLILASWIVLILVHRIILNRIYFIFQDAGSQQIGFLLGSCSVAVALTSEICYKGLPKSTTGEVVSFKGWPKLYWFLTEHLPKPPKDWMPPPR